MTPADELRTAVEKLRTLAERVNDDLSLVDDPNDPNDPNGPLEAHWTQASRNELGPIWGAYAAAMHPGVGLAIADWMEETARNAEPFGKINARAVAVARAINGTNP
ncbi:hypothetical protein ACGFZU_06895 [Streptomyces tendae]|uniref:hypothetical protein n=1 Tax=Streptomyces tendae TaxID=1932 RepID=UPI00371444C5